MVVRSLSKSLASIRPQITRKSIHKDGSLNNIACITCSACIACTKCPSYLTCISCISCKPALLTLLVSLAKLVLHAFLESLVLFVLLWQFVPLSLLDSWMIWKSMGFWVTEKKLISVSCAKLWIHEMPAHLKMCKNDWKSRQWSQK